MRPSRFTSSDASVKSYFQPAWPPRQRAVLPLLTMFLLAVCMPASADRFLGKLSIPTAVIFGVGSTTGTVSLDGISSKPVTIVLKSSDANV